MLTDEEINNARAKTIGLPLICRQQHRDIARAQAVKTITEIEKQSAGLNFTDGVWHYLIPEAYIEKLKQEVGL